MKKNLSSTLVLGAFLVFSQVLQAQEDNSTQVFDANRSKNTNRIETAGDWNLEKFKNLWQSTPQQIRSAEFPISTVFKGKVLYSLKDMYRKGRENAGLSKVLSQVSEPYTGDMFIQQKGDEVILNIVHRQSFLFGVEWLFRAVFEIGSDSTLHSLSKQVFIGDFENVEIRNDELSDFENDLKPYTDYPFYIIPIVFSSEVLEAEENSTYALSWTLIENASFDIRFVGSGDLLESHLLVKIDIKDGIGNLASPVRHVYQLSGPYAISTSAKLEKTLKSFRTALRIYEIFRMLPFP